MQLDEKMSYWNDLLSGEGRMNKSMKVTPKGTNMEFSRSTTPSRRTKKVVPMKFSM